MRSEGTGPAPKEREARQPQREPLSFQYSLGCFVGSKRRSHSGTANLIINSYQVLEAQEEYHNLWEIQPNYILLLLFRSDCTFVYMHVCIMTV
jgi:hypothetical protein